MQNTTELHAELQVIGLSSPRPQALADFYRAAYGLSVDVVDGCHRCSGPGRRVHIVEGPANRLAFAQFGLHDAPAWQRFTERVRGLPAQALPPHCPPQAVALRDPDGNLVVFTPPQATAAAASAAGLPPAVLQHFALRTPDMAGMLAFYTEQVGLVLSDAVRDAEGRLRACFLRSDSLHHALALFFAPAACFDHQSFEAPDWAAMKTWGDRMAALRTPIVWGIGRHGPGNDVFFMVRDPDGNLAEISAEIEHCAPGRPAGEWPHEERTLNLWGKAILRS